MGASTSLLSTTRARLASTLRTLTAAEWLFYAGFTVSVCAAFLLRIMLDPVGPAPKSYVVESLYALGALLLLAKVAIDAEVSWRYAVSLALVVLCYVTLFTSGIWRFSLLFLVVAAGKGAKVRYLAAIVLALSATTLVVAVTLAAAGVIPSTTVWRMIDGTWQPRSSHGFIHPNTLGAVAMALACSFAVLRYPRFRVPDAVFYVALAAIVAVLTESRTGIVGIVLAGILAAAAPAIVRTPGRKRAAAVAGAIVLVLCTAVSLWMMVFYDEGQSWMVAIDQAVSTRFSLAHRFYDVFPPRVFGREIMAVRLDTLVQEAPDNAYARAIVKHGIVPALVLAVMLVGIYVHALRTEGWDASLAGLSVYAVASVMERYSLDPAFNYFFVVCALILWSSSKRAEPTPVRGAHARRLS